MSTPAAFLSYARLDDEHSEGHLSDLRGLLEREMQSITGDVDFRIFQDQQDVAWGQQWQNRINESIDGSLLLIPIISPLFFKRLACRDELTRFLERESQLGRSDLILPIYFIDISNFTSNNPDELIAILAQRQYRDWREFRHENLKTSDSKKRIAGLAREMNEALFRKPTPQELELRRKREVQGRLEKLLVKIGGPFRSSRVLQGLAKQLGAVGIDTLERLLLQSEQDLREAGLTDQIIQSIVEDLTRHGQKLREPSVEVHPLDRLVLTPGCRNAVRASGIETVDDLASKSWNELMLTGHFLPDQIDEVSLRLQTELGRNLREMNEHQLTYDDILARRASR
jgi:hypothetical protein